jgi:hypothetical protein
VTKSEGIALGFREFEQGTVSFFGYNQAGQGVLKRGTILATGGGADVGKLVLLSPTTEAYAYGVLLDPSIDTSAAFSDGSVTGSIARAGSFKGSALIVPPGVDAGLIAVALRGRGIFLRGRYHSSSGCCRYRGLKIHKEIPRERLWWGRIELSHQSFFTMLCLVMSCPFTPGHVEPTGLAMRTYASLDRACI